MIKNTAIFSASILILFFFKDQAITQKNASDNNPRYFIATASKLLVRSKPGRKSEIIDAVLKGHRIDIYEKTNKEETIDGVKGEWLKAASTNGKIGYVFSGYLTPVEAQAGYHDSSDFSSNLSCKNNWEECIKNIERNALKNNFSRVSRNNDSLIFTHDNGKKTVLKNINSESENFRSYHLIQYYPEMRSFAVHIQYNEGSSFYLIHDGNDNKTEIWGLPVISPEKDKFVSYNIGIVAGFSRNGMQIFKINKNASISQLFEIEKKWGPINVQWAGTNKIVSTRLDFIDGGYISSRGEIEITGNKFILHE